MNPPSKPAELANQPDQQPSQEKDTRQAILDAARELFISEGYEGVSMRMVARIVGISPTAIYGHFTDKEDLFLHLCHEDYHRLAVAFAQFAQLPDPVERLRAIGRAYMEFGINNPNHYRMMFMTAHPGVAKGHEEEMGKGNPEEDSYAFLLLSVTEALKAGAFRPEIRDPHIIAQTLWAGVHGVVTLHIAKADDAWVPWCSLKERGEFMLDGLLNGMLKEKEGKK